MSIFEGEPIDLSKPVLETYEIKCPKCHYPVRMINNEKAPDYWKHIAEAYKKQLKDAQKLFYKMDEFCMLNIGNTYLQHELKKIYNKWNEGK